MTRRGAELKGRPCGSLSWHCGGGGGGVCRVPRQGRPPDRRRHAGSERDQDVPARAVESLVGEVVSASARGRSATTRWRRRPASTTRRCGSDHRAEVSRLLLASKPSFNRSHKAYEEEEGIIAGVPSLARYDVIMDSGTSAKDDPEDGGPVQPDAARTAASCGSPGNFFHALLEPTLWGTDSRFVAKSSAKVDLDGDGKVEFGEVLPDANVLVGIMRGFDKFARESDAKARAWKPTALGCVDGARRDGADDGGLLRRVEELPVHPRQQGAGEGVRVALAADRRPRDPAQPAQRLLGREAPGRPVERRAEQPDRLTAERAVGVRGQHLRQGDRREAVQAERGRPARDRRRRSRRTRSPGRSARSPAHSGSSCRPEQRCSDGLSCSGCWSSRLPAAPRRGRRRRAPRPARPSRGRPTSSSTQALFDVQLGVTLGDAARATARSAQVDAAAAGLAALARRRSRRLEAATAARLGRRSGAARRGGRRDAGRGRRRPDADRGVGRVVRGRGRVEARRGNAAAAQQWLLVRGFEGVTRYTHPGAAATVAVGRSRTA